MTHPRADEAAEAVLAAALRVLTAERALDLTPHADADAEAEYAREKLALAARILTRATDALPPDHQPVGWHGSGGRCFP